MVENKEVKNLSNFQIQTDKHLTHNKPYMIAVMKKEACIIDTTDIGNRREIVGKELEKRSVWV